jgi:hypothetical protein
MERLAAKQNPGRAHVVTHVDEEERQVSATP